MSLSCETHYWGYHKLTPHHKNTSAAMQSGFYLGGNAGAWWTSDRNINQVGTPWCGFPNFHLSDISINKNLRFLGTLRGRVGTLLTPKVFAFGTGGLAYGNTSLKASFSYENPTLEQLNPNVFPPFSIQKKVSKTLVGWTAGGGFEWAFLPNWSAKIEGLYYNLGSLNNTLELKQYVNNPNGQLPLIGLFASAKVLTSTVFANSLVRVGVNYHFS